MNREAFVDNFRRLPMFRENLDEFKDSREVKHALLKLIFVELNCSIGCSRTDR